MKVKICGLTRPEEAAYLNEAGADYAGFVFFKKSKRNVTISQAKEIKSRLNKKIQAVAVTVSPEAELVRKLEKASFSILQIHGELTAEVLEMAQLPIWYAVNIADAGQLAQRTDFLGALPQRLSDKIEALVVDGAEYGSGKTFDWTKQLPTKLFSGRKFVLAGGLNAGNVREGIARFAPDIVDVSSGVEGTSGKDEKLIFDFIRKAKENE
jgi:phosphoribosylanthranilate isomerase